MNFPSLLLNSQPIKFRYNCRLYTPSEFHRTIPFALVGYDIGYSLLISNAGSCINLYLLFIFHKLYEFLFPGWLICATWHRLWRDNLLASLSLASLSLASLSWCKFYTPLSLHHGIGWLTQSLTIFVCSVFNLNKKYVNALNARELWGFTCTRSLIMNSKFSIPQEAASCGIKISRLLSVNSCR